MAGPPPPLPHALHPHRVLLDQPGRAVVRLPHRPEDPPRQPQKHPDPRERHPRLDRRLEYPPQALHLDQDRRGDPRIPREILPTNFRRMTLVPWPVTFASFGWALAG